MILQNTHTVTISNDIAEQWKMSDDIFQGTHNLRKLTTQYLPKFVGEEDTAYSQRISRAVLKNVYKKTLTKAVGGMLKNGITAEGFDTENVDGKQTNLAQFVADVGVTAVKYGLAYILVDAPQAGEGLTELQARQRQLKPYLTIINNLTVQEIKYNFIAGRVVPIYFQYKYIMPDLEGEFSKSYSLESLANETGDQKLVVVWEVFKIVDGKREVTESGWIDIPVLPVSVVYGSEHKDEFINAPPYLDLGYANIMHYQSTSDSAIAHHVASTPMLFSKGAGTTKRDDKGNRDDEPVKISAWSAISSNDPTAEVKWIETTGAALTQHREWLRFIEDMMDEMSLAFNLTDPEVTATANLIQSDDNESGLVLLKNELERGFKSLINTWGLYSGEDLSQVYFLVNTAGLSALTEEQLARVKELWKDGLITREQYFEAVNRSMSIDLKLAPEPKPADQPPEKDSDNSLNIDESTADVQ